jgi:hypothetical protein
MSKQNTEVTVFYGEQPTHSHERRAVRIVCDELARRGISATLLVNFTVVANGAPQIDLVIITDQRCLNVELKCLDPELPLIATPNGPWRQLLPDGTDRLLDDRNFYDQAIQQTYGLSDTLAKYADRGVVPGSQHDKFYKHIDTVVCVSPHIPDGSRTPRHRKVSVVGLNKLIDRVAQPGPGLTHWTREHWQEVIRREGLYAEGDDDPAVLRRRGDAAAIQDYRRRFREFTAAGLEPLIPATARIGGQPATADAPTLATELTLQRRRLLLAGASGDGKTHLAKHTALALTDNGQIVLWIAADDYEKDRLGRSLARAVGPFSTEKAEALLAKAAEAGTGITVIIDALEKCPHREELLKQLHALQQQHPASVLVTTADTADTEPLAATTHVTLASPIGEERARLATIYGTSDGVAESGEYTTRYSITLAAQVITDLGAGASSTDVLDSYIRRRTQNETVRTGLRCLAAAMDHGVRTALPIAEAMLTLRRCPPLATTPSAIDDTLASQLVRIHQGRVRFDHEQLGRFLAAEHLVLSAPDGAALAQLLDQPAHHDLQRYALLLESDAGRRYEVIRHLSDWQLIADAARGKFGDDTAKQARADITELLVQATATAPESTFVVDDRDSAWFGGTWQSTRQWTAIEHALLAAAGHCVRSGLFHHEIAALMDATDIAVRAAITELRTAAADTSPITRVIGATFAPFSRGADDAAASIVAHAAHLARVFNDDAADTPTATEMWKPNPHCYGRLYMAALLSHPVRHSDDAENLPDLVETGLSMGGYHLRLMLLEAAQYGCTSLEGAARQRMIEVLHGYDPPPGDWGTSTTLIEALAGYDEITPINTLEGIQASIAEVLRDVDDPDHQTVARSIVSNMFDDERVLGPFSEAVDALPDDQRLMLFAMSVLAPGLSVSNDYAMRHLADNVARGDGIIARALAHGAAAVPAKFGLPQQEIAAHLHGLRGWAKVSPTLPPAAADADPADPEAIAWRLLDELLLSLLRGGVDPARTDQIWQQLITEVPIAATGVLSDIDSALQFANFEASVSGRAQFTPHQLLLASYPDHIRRLLEWALTHRDEFGPVHQRGPWSVSSYAVRTLAEVGTAETADLLRHHYIHDAQLGADAVAAVRTLDARIQT